MPSNHAPKQKKTSDPNPPTARNKPNAPAKNKGLAPDRFFSELSENWPLLLFGLLLGLVLAEGLIRIADPIPIGAQRKDDTLGWANAENAQTNFSGALAEQPDGRIAPQFLRRIQINSIGLRDTERAYEKPPDTYRILVLGDSMVAGFEVDLNDTFTQRLEQTLRARTNRNIEVINAGVRGYSNVQELLYLQTQGKKFRPDLVLLNFTHNDVLDNEGARHGVLGVQAERPVFERDSNGSLRLKPPYQTQKTPIDQIGDFFGPQVLPAYCRLCNILLLQIKSRLPNEPDPETDQRKNTTYHALDGGQADDARWQTTREILLKIRNEAADQNARFLMGVFPPEVDIDPQTWNQLLNENPWLRDKNPAPDKPTRIIRAFATDHHILLFDPTPALRDARKQGASVFWPVDGHLTEKGHEIYANGLADFILTHNLA